MGIRLLAAVALGALLAGCSPSSGAQGSSGAADPAATAAAEAAQRQQQFALALEQYKAQLADYRTQEAQRQQICDEIDARQVDLNAQYQQIKHGSPMTANVVLTYMRKSAAGTATADDTSSTQSGCLLLAMGDGDCADIYNKIRYAKEQQRLLNNKAQQACCRLSTAQDAYADLGLSFAPQCTIPAPPEAPTPPQG